MSNVVTPLAFKQFPAPYRIMILHDQIKTALAHLGDVEITLEPLVMDDDAASFPVLQFDTCRVYIRRGTFSVNVHGVIHDNQYFFRAAAYDGDAPANGGMMDAPMSALSDLVAYVKAQFEGALSSG